MDFHLFAYELIDFKGGDLPVEFEGYFLDQLLRARTVLERRSNAEIAYTLDALDYMLREGSHKLLKGIMDANVEFAILSRPKALKSYMSHFALEGQESLPDARWADFFAALSLACILEALYTFNYPEVDQLPGITYTDEEREKARFGHICERSVEAMDAVCYAEQMAVIEGVQDNNPGSKQLVSMVMSQLGKKGKKRSLTPFAKLRNKLLKRHDKEYQNISARKAARILAAEFPEDVADVLKNNEDPEQQIAIWIGQHRRMKT